MNNGNFSIGNEISCSVRPESISITDNIKEGKINQFEARIKSLTYLGDVEEYWLNIRNSLEVKVIVHNPGQHERKPGGKVYTYFDPSSVILLMN